MPPPVKKLSPEVASRLVDLEESGPDLSGRLVDLEPIPNTPIQQSAPSPSQKPGLAKAAGMGAAQYGSYGFADEAAGLGSKIADYFSPATAEGHGESSPTRTESPYKSMRNSWRRDDTAAREAHPIAYHGAGLVTGAATQAALAPLAEGGALARGAGYVLAPSSLGGAVAQGALIGTGASEGETAGEVAKDALAGGAFGGAVHTIAPAVVKELPKMFGEKSVQITQPAGARLKRFIANNRLAQAGITEAQAARTPAGKYGTVKNMQEQGIARGLEGREKIVEQADRAIANADRTRSELLGSPSAPIRGGGARVANSLDFAASNQGRAGLANANKTALMAEAADLEQQARPTVPNRPPNPALAPTVADPRKPYVYHATPSSNMERIRNEGLQPSEGGKNYNLKKNKNTLYFSPEDQAQKWSSDVADMTGGEPTTQLRGRITVAPSEGANPGILERKTPVGPERLEMYQGGRWTPLKEPVPEPKPPLEPSWRLEPQPEPPPVSPEQQAANELRARAAQIKEPHEGAGVRRNIRRMAQDAAPRDLTRGEVNQMRKEWGEGWKNPANAGDKAEAYRAGHEVVNDVLESEIGSKNPDAGRAWRTTGQKEASAILARDSAERALGRSQQRGLGWRDASAAAVGAQASESTPGKIIGGLAGVAGRMLFAGRQHAVAATAAEGLQAAGRIAGTVGGPVARFVRQTPVERAASLKAARDHYLRSSTDPDYNKKNYGTQ